MSRPELTPCIICGTKIEYLVKNAPKNDLLNEASTITIESWINSDFDGNEYKATICDNCLDDAIQNNLVRFNKELPQL